MFHRAIVIFFFFKYYLACLILYLTLKNKTNPSDKITS